MPVARASSAESIRTDTSDPYNFTFTPSGTPHGIVIGVVHGVSSTDHVVGITYGGVALTRSVRATDTVTEPGAAELWFLGNSIPTGAQTVSLDLASATTDDLHVVVWEISATTDTKVIDSDSISENAANPTRTMNKGSRTGISLCIMYGGGAAPGGTLAAENTLDHTHDLGAFYSQSCYETTVDSADHTIGWSTLGTDDLAFVAICVTEVETFSGAASLTTTAAVTTAGTRSTFGAASSTTTAAITTAGARLVFGATSLTITAVISTSGIRTATGAMSLTTSATITTAGTRSTFGSVSRSTVVGITTVGTRSTDGSSSLTVTVGITAAGTRQSFGSVSLTTTISVATTGTRATFGAVARSTLIMITTNGTVTGGGPQTHFGATSLTLTITITTAGASVDKEEFGAVSGGDDAAGTVSGGIRVAGRVSGSDRRIGYVSGGNRRSEG